MATSASSERRVRRPVACWRGRMLTAGVVMSAVSGIPPALGLAPRGDAPPDGRNPDGFPAVTSHLGGENPGLAACFAGAWPPRARGGLQLRPRRVLGGARDPGQRFQNSNGWAGAVSCSGAQQDQEG